jgi:predicted tellurium resistance membrane protein TerC
VEHGAHFLILYYPPSLTRLQVKVATPLLLVVTVIELSDVVFAVDSIPAIFGVTTDPFIVYTSNMFAILSLRALYGFVATVVDELEYLQTAVALVLGFIGLKLVGEVRLAARRERLGGSATPSAFPSMLTLTMSGTAVCRWG